MLACRFKGISFSVSLRWSPRAHGINSVIRGDVLGENKHALLMDIDKAPSLIELCHALDRLLQKYNISDAHVLRSSGNPNDEQTWKYHIYIFTAVSYVKAFEILCDSEMPYSDKMHAKLGAIRDYWTLRLPGKGKKYKKLAIVPGVIKADISPHDLKEYETYRRHTL